MSTRVSLEDIRSECERFLKKYFIGDQRELGLRLISLGNPERTVQGELVHYLRARGFLAVSECGVYRQDSARRNLDIVVFAGEDWAPLAVIELKHYSGNQGSPEKLASDLQKDTDKHAMSVRDLPLIQIGLFSRIINLEEPFKSDMDKESGQNGLYRFVKTYYKKPIDLRSNMEKLEDLGFSGAAGLTGFAIKGGPNVKGQVSYIIKLRESTTH